MKEKAFFLNLCLPSVDAQSLDAALCPFCSITDAIGELGRGSALVTSPMLGSG